MESKRYRIDGSEIKNPVVCKCGNLVDCDEVAYSHINGAVYKYYDDGNFNQLIILDLISRCCDKPNYSFLKE